MQLVSTVRQRGAEGLVITDHHYRWTDFELERLRVESDLPDEFLIMSGQEVFTADFGDVLVYGADKSIGNGIALSVLRRENPGAALVWAHPYRYGRFPTVVDLMNSNFDAIEMVNPHHTEEENQRAVADWKTWKYRVTSGSDIHRTDFSEFYPVRFDCHIDSMEGLVSCMKEGRFAPQLGSYGVDEASGEDPCL